MCVIPGPLLSQGQALHRAEPGIQNWAGTVGWAKSVSCNVWAEFGELGSDVLAKTRRKYNPCRLNGHVPVADGLGENIQTQS